ncbi:HD domain-containing protein [Desulfurivibrio sp. C05AmB]|jgi:hypothetical protein|uniref:HD domain-containing protein n=1 Tax=Desulfurivibrio sp. C05AmB TaxID=3374371 RepID=UPI00376EB874
MQCPGQDSRYWTGSAVFETSCEKCGAALEFFKDDSTRVCKKCGHRMLNPQIDFGCASYCPYAEQCLGQLPPELLKKKQEELVEKVAAAAKKLYGTDFARIGHAGRVARHAAELAAAAEGANPAVVRIAAYLHDLYQPELEPAAATGPIRELLAELAANPGLVEEVCAAVAHLHQPGPEAGINLTILTAAHQRARQAGE